MEGTQAVDSPTEVAWRLPSHQAMPNHLGRSCWGRAVVENPLEETAEDQLGELQEETEDEMEEWGL